MFPYTEMTLQNNVYFPVLEWPCKTTYPHTDPTKQYISLYRDDPTKQPIFPYTRVTLHFIKIFISGLFQQAALCSLRYYGCRNRNLQQEYRR